MIPASKVDSFCNDPVALRTGSPQGGRKNSLEVTKGKDIKRKREFLNSCILRIPHHIGKSNKVLFFPADFFIMKISRDHSNQVGIK